MLLKKAVDFAIKRLAVLQEDLNPEFAIPVLPEQKGYEYTLPANIDCLPEKIKKFYNEVKTSNPYIPSRHILHYKNVYVSYDGVVFKNLKLATASLDYPNLKKEYQDAYLLKQWLNKVVVLPPNTTIAVAYDAHSTNNYYHWLIETCPRLLLLKENNSEALLLVPTPTPEFIKLTTKLLGFNRQLYIKKNEVIKASHVILPEHSSDDNFYSISHQDPTLLQKLRLEILTKLNVPITTPFKRIYVSRAKQKSRRIINEKELIKFLEKYDFETIYFEELSFLNQVELMNTTAILIGVHGANLANILFMQPKTYVIEIENEEWHNLVYFRLASYLQLCYSNLRCAQQNKQVQDNSDVIIDLKNIQSILNSILVNH